MTAAATVFSNHGPPPPIVIGSDTSRRELCSDLRGPGMGGEKTRQPHFFNAAVPEGNVEGSRSGHTGGINAHPVEYEQRIVGFLDDALRNRTCSVRG